LAIYNAGWVSFQWPYCHFGDRGMIAYVEMIQRKEAADQVELLTHQKWSGAELVDRMVNVASGGVSSTAAMGHGVTEAQFSAKL
jgi:isocitrate lyase